MKKESVTSIGHQILSVFLGVMTTLVIKEALTRPQALNENMTLTIITMVSIVLWYLYIDILMWAAKKIPDEKQKETKEM